MNPSERAGLRAFFPLLLWLVGLWVFVAPFLPDMPPYAWISSVFGGEAGFLRLMLGLLFLVVSTLVTELQRQRRVLSGFMRIIRETASGQDAQKQAQAVDILVKAMASEKADVRASARTALVGLLGTDCGDDAAAWEAHWTARRPQVSERSERDLSRLIS